MLAVLMLVGVLMGLTAPSLQRWIRAQQVDSAAALLMDALRLARSHALRWGMPVTVCPLPTGAATDLINPSRGGAQACDESSQDWSGGWMIFLDPERDGHLGPSDTLMTVYQPFTAAQAQATMSRVTFQPAGIVEFPHAGSAVQISLGAGALRHTRRICMSKPGRVRLAPVGAQAC